MKTLNKSRRHSGFTLIELLVVVSIVAVLAAMSFAGVMGVMRNAKKKQGEVAANNLATGLDRFFSEYNRLPELDSLGVENGGGNTENGEGVLLLSILLAEDNQDTRAENPRLVNFIDIQPAKGKKGGLVYNNASGGTVQALYDPFGQPYTVILNLDDDNPMEFTYAGKIVRLRGKKAAVFSPGADGELGNKDDIASFDRLAAQ